MSMKLGGRSEEVHAPLDSPHLLAIEDEDEAIFKVTAKKALPILPGDPPTERGSTTRDLQAIMEPKSVTQELRVIGIVSKTPVSTDDCSVEVKLSDDVSLIIVGDGPEAVELLRKRRREGGRACLLWTHRPPGKADVRRAGNKDLDAAKLEVSTFVWKPPSLESSHPEVVRMQKENRCWTSCVQRSGPDIVELKPTECYNLTRDSADRENGVEVWDVERMEQVWALTGAVVLCGPELQGLSQVHCESMSRVNSLDVSVHFEDAKPLATTVTWKVALGIVYSFLHMLLYCWVMGTYEPSASQETLPIWRLSFSLGVLPFGAFMYPIYWGTTLSGERFSCFGQMVAGVIAVALFSIFALHPSLVTAHDDASLRTRPVFVICCEGAIFYILVAFLQQRCTSSGKISDHPDGTKPEKMEWVHHAFWFGAHVLTTFGSWMWLYCVSLLFVYLENHWPVLAACFLTFTTSLTEKVVSKLLGVTYTRMIYHTRCRPDKGYIRGDQQRFLVIPVAMTHAFCESVRLVSLISVVARNPSWTWLPNVLFNVFVNFLERSNLMLSLATITLPWCDFMVPGMSMIVLHDVKLHSGYAQYAAVVAIILANLLLHGTEKPVLFNKECLVLLGACVVLEICEDILVLRLPSSLRWRKQLLPFYESQPLLHPRQLLLMDSQGTHCDRVPLPLHGTRALDLSEHLMLLQPPVYFSLVLMTLLLGAGFVHGVCEAPIPRELRIIDSLLWESPLKCA
ncbi:unnamed protein product [Effrenium voratum]|uniref:Uncharacterized protein n=1 Tax=Effrenium voratum TaxID=2562239 RepID=A0AA36JMU2_9DINO|nr:unnamed protein product [Effrenium voratum]